MRDFLGRKVWLLGKPYSLRGLGWALRKAKPPPIGGGFSVKSWPQGQAGLNNFSRPREASAGAQPFTAL